MTTWVMVYMACFKMCTPVYAETFQDQTACTASVDNRSDKYFKTCVPIITNGIKK